MIKKLLFIGALTLSTAVSAQTNLSFETWTASGLGYEDPNGWFTLNILSLFGAPVSAEKSTDAHAGTYSCQLTSVEADLGDGPETVPGIAALSADGASAGVAYTSRPDSIIFWYKYTPQGSDNGAAFATLTNDGADVGSADIALPAQATWKRVGMKFAYDNGNTPDTLNLGFASSSDSPVAGSILKVDAVEIKMGTGTSGNKEVVASADILMYPNPAKNELNVRLEQEATIEIYNVLGEKVSTLRSNGTDKTVIPVADYTNGVYLLKTSTGITQRFVVKH